MDGLESEKKFPRKIDEQEAFSRNYGKTMLIRRFKNPRTGKIEEQTVFDSDKGSVAIFALTKNQEVVATREFLYGVEDVVLGIPGGNIESKEPPEESAKRELLEETGYKAEKIVRLGDPNCPQYHEPHRCTFSFIPFLAMGCIAGESQSLDNGEFIDVELIPISEWICMAVSGDISESKSVAVTLLASAHLNLINLV
jgi:ADP-ribose pyrophosphatase